MDSRGIPRNPSALVRNKLSEFAKTCTPGSPQFNAPVLMWESPGSLAAHGETKPTPDAKARRRQPTVPIPNMSLAPRDEPPPGTEPLVFSLIKKLGGANPFAMGVTIGRIDNNDVVLDHASVSRFHAWFAEDSKGWGITDAESLYGTWMGGKRLVQNARTKVADKSQIRIGKVELLFLEVRTLLDMMTRGLLHSR